MKNLLTPETAEFADVHSNPLLGPDTVEVADAEGGISKRTITLPEKNDSLDGLRISMLLRLCLVGFFVNLQPSEPYLTRYLIEDKVNIYMTSLEVLWRWIVFVN